MPTFRLEDEHGRWLADMRLVAGGPRESCATGFPGQPSHMIPSRSFGLADPARGERNKPRGGLVASVLVHFETDDYDTWKPMFDSDPAGHKQSATSHSILRSVDNPNAVFVRVEFPSVDEATAFRKRLIDSGVLERVNVKVGPTVVERAEEVTY
jgi:hypothetical protein